MCKIFVALNFRGCVKFSWSLLFIFVVKKFRALNFRGLGQQRNFFNNENFPIYGICIFQAVRRAVNVLNVSTCI